MAKYDAYVKTRTRDVLAEKGITLDRAIDFLGETKNGVVVDIETLKKYHYKEELKYVKNIRSEPGVGTDNFPSSRPEVYEDSYRELFKSLGDNTESSPECDN